MDSDADDDQMEVDTDNIPHTDTQSTHEEQTQHIQDARKTAIEENERLKKVNKELQRKLEISRFGIQRFSTDDAKICF